MEVARESVFVSSIRSLCKTFAGVLGIVLALSLIAIFVVLFSSPFHPVEKTQLTILPDLQDELEIRALDSPVVLQINIHGIIGDPTLNSQTIKNILVDSQRSVLTGRIKAILLDLNTPGGTVFDADAIYTMLKQYKETYQIPIYGYVSGLCASGGMYVSSVCDQIYASPVSVIGSVGVIIGPFFNVVDALNKIGVQSKTLTEGLDKDMLSPFRPWKPGEDTSLQEIIEFQYKRFVDVVTTAHPRLDRDKLVNEYGAKVFDAVKAQEYGYIDQANFDYKSTLQALMAAAHIDASHPYQVVELELNPGLMGLLTQTESPLFTGKIEHCFNFGDPRSSQIRDQFAYLYIPGVSQ